MAQAPDSERTSGGCGTNGSARVKPDVVGCAARTHQGRFYLDRPGRIHPSTDNGQTVMAVLQACSWQAVINLLSTKG